ncbi:MAG: MarR family transcriptional regulator [Halobacteriota archaeon]
MKSIEPACHEFAANYLFAENGLAPYFAADSRVKQGGGSQVSEFRADGERWRVKLYYQSSNIVHPGDCLPSGTEWRLDEIREFRFAVKRHAEEDPVGQQSFNAHLSPRWRGMKAQKRNGTQTEISVPKELGEAVNVRVKGSNIDFRRYGKLLRLAAQAVGIRWDYFEEPHEYSNVQDAERYVRVHKDASGPVHARDGPIASMGHLLENDRRGYRKVVQNDDDEHGRNLPGYYHTVTLGTRRIREAFPHNEIPVEVKHYYAREALSVPKDHPLRHPKVGVSYQVSRWDRKLGVSPDDLDQLVEELDRVLRAVLADAGLDLAPIHGDGPFVEDAYFPAEVTDGHEKPLSLDLTRVRQEQETVVIRYLADGLSPVEWESLQTLVSDGGTVSPQDIADSHGRHVESVRRALRRIDEMVERKYGEVALRSPYIAELVHDAVQNAREATRRAVEVGAKAIEAAERGLDETTSAFIAWCAKHGVDVDGRRDAQLKVRLGELDPDRDSAPEFLVRRAFELWKTAKQDVGAFRMAMVEYGRPNGPDRSVPVWRLIG